MNDLLITFIVALISMMIGYLISSVIRTLSTKEPNEQIGRTAAVRKPERASKTEPDQTEVASFYRESAGGSVRVRMDGKILQTPEDLTIEQRRHMIQLITDLKPWLIGPQRNELGATQTNPQRISGAPLITLPAVITEATVVAAAPKSMVTQIDDILQAQIAGTPLFKRGIRLTESPTQGVIVWIGPKSHDGIDGVPDPEIVAAIRQAVKTWENL